MTIHTRRPRRGYTLIEILITLVVMGIVAGAVTKLLVSQTRYFDQQVGLRNARAVSRTAINVLTSDLRMVQDTLGITSASTDGKSITVRVPYRFGVVCYAPNVAGAAMTVLLAPVDSAANAMAVFSGWAYRDDAAAGYGEYLFPASPSVASPSGTDITTCTTPVNAVAGGTGVRSVTAGSQSSTVVNLQPGNNALGGTIPVGRAIMLYQTITYQFKASTSFPGRIGLWRTVAGGQSEELMAPFSDASRFRYYLANSTYTSLDDTSRTTIAAGSEPLIKGVDIVLVGQSPKKAWGKTTYTRSINVTSVFFRNIRS